MKFKNTQREAVQWQLFFVSMFMCIHAVKKLGRNEKFKSNVVFIYWYKRRRCTMFSDELDEKELDIKLDITKKSRKINRPTCFADQTGGFLKKIFFFKLIVKPAYQAD